MLVVRPYSHKIVRSIHKTFKVYFFDNGDVLNGEGPRFENFIAAHLIKRCHFLKDYTGANWELHFLRDREQREVDFAIICDGKIIELIEVKLSDDHFSTGFMHLIGKINPQKATQIILNGNHDYKKGNLYKTDPFDYFAKSIW